MSTPSETEDRQPVERKVVSEWVRLVRASGRCECSGECGTPNWHLDTDRRCRNRHGRAQWGDTTSQRVVVLHSVSLDPGAPGTDPATVLALCGPCRLGLERTRDHSPDEDTRLHTLGMQPLFELTELLDP